MNTVTSTGVQQSEYHVGMTNPSNEPTITSIQYMDKDGLITDDETPDTVTGMVNVTNPDGSRTIARIGEPLTGPPEKVTRVTFN